MFDIRGLDERKWRFLRRRTLRRRGHITREQRSSDKLEKLFLGLRGDLTIGYKPSLQGEDGVLGTQ